MNVYDFDNTIYDGESSVDFFMFCIKKNKRLMRLIPLLMYKLVKYKLCLISIDELEVGVEKYALEFSSGIDDLESTVDEFWKTHMHKIKDCYKKTQRNDDVVISASFGFLLDNICKRLGIKKCICSEINIKTGKIEKLCFRSNKVELFHQELPNYIIDKFYTDSMNDKPLIDISREAYIVKGSKIKRIK